MQDFLALLVVVIGAIFLAYAGYQTGHRDGYRQGVAVGMHGKLHEAGSAAFNVELPNGNKVWFED